MSLIKTGRSGAALLLQCGMVIVAFAVLAGALFQ
jgi:hypothetical protein